MVWGCMALTAPRMLHICEGSINSVKFRTILERVYERYLAKIYDNNVLVGDIFQQDNTTSEIG